jgi:small subunit ribosomal protein S16
MLSIKLRRIGKKHQPSFRIIVAEKRSKLNGRYIEDLGWMNPFSKKFSINKARVTYWLNVGAQPTDSVYNLFVKSGIVVGAKRAVHKNKKAKEA